MTKKVKEEKEALQCRIRILESGMKDLQFLYDKELEWKPYENQKLYIQEEYDKRTSWYVYRQHFKTRTESYGL